MAPLPTRRFLHASALTRQTVALSMLIVLATATFLALRYPSLPALLPVHFAWNGRPNGWQYRTVARVLMPAFVQLAIAMTCGAVAALLLFRRDASTAGAQPAAQAAVTAAEAVTLLGAIWVAFQGYAAYALVALWTHGGATLGKGYSIAQAAGFLATIVVAVRAQLRLVKPEALPYVAAHWRAGHLYCNADDPALFAPTRNGRRWTLNFGRRSAVVLLAVILAMGIVAPTILLALAFR